MSTTKISIMSDNAGSAFASRIEELRAENDDRRLFVDALLEEYDKLSTSEMRNSSELGEEILRVSRDIGYERGEALGLLAVGMVHYLWQRNREAFACILEAKPRIDAMEGELIAQARCAGILAGLHTTMGNYQRALEYGHEALSKIDGIEPTEWHGWPNYMLGEAYRAMGEFGRAREHFTTAYEIFVSIDVETGVTRALIGLGGVCRDEGDLASSEQYFQEARRLSERRADSVSMARILSDLAILRRLTGDYEESLQLFQESLAIRRERAVGLIVATCLIDLGRLLCEIDRVDEAIERLTEALEISSAHEHGPRMYAAHEGLSDAFAKKGDLEKALAHHKEFQRIKEEVMGADTATRLQNLEFSLEAAAAQKEAELIRAHNAELQAKNTELGRLLKELRDAQEMLIQSEKMASLGQLTAGIAHEIKNPLNFVNNFSALTKDLADELTDEIVEHRDQVVSSIEQQILELASEINANAERILEHGRRAGQIVNGMLVHTRQSGGKKTDVNVNELVSDSLDLAYHGFLVNHQGCKVIIDQQLAEDAGTFKVIEDEVARVFTNIMNNAFYAVRERVETLGEEFVPRVVVSSVRLNGMIEVRISDNGAGIPDDLKKKVFEPFFTTKPTGSGTGLGLSQSYEIVSKRHGGTLTVTDTDGGGATFVVSIPAG